MRLKLQKIFFIFLFFIILIPFSSAIIGVRPASYEINFEPEKVFVFSFNFIIDSGAKLELYSEGAFSEYVTLSKDHLYGGGSVNVLLQLPLEPEQPGKQRLFIGGRQVASGDTGGVGIVGNAKGVIVINVPYPGKYAELEFSTSNANVGDDVDFNLKIYSRGKEDINANSRIEIYDLQNHLIETINLGTHLIKSTENIELKSTLDTTDYVAGDYRALAVVDYEEGVSESERIFRLGRLFVGVTNHTRVFERNKINRFEIEAESFWNDPITNVYAEVNIIDYPRLDFLTPSVLIEPWSKRILVGFFDSSEIKEEDFKAKITLHYEGEITEKIVNLKLEKRDNTIIYLVIGIVLIVGVGITSTFVIIKKKKKK